MFMYNCPQPRIPSPRISPTTYSVTTYFPHHVFRHHVFPPPRIPIFTLRPRRRLRPTSCCWDDTTCFWSTTDSNRIIIIIYLARPLTYCGRDIWNCSKVNFLFELAVEASRRMRITSYRQLPRGNYNK